MIKKIVHWLGKLFLAYLVTGAVYYISGYVYHLSIGKLDIFSPIVGLPLTILGWP